MFRPLLQSYSIVFFFYLSLKKDKRNFCSSAFAVSYKKLLQICFSFPPFFFPLPLLKGVLLERMALLKC